MKKILKYFIPLFSLFIVSSCDDFLDINKDINNPLDARLNQLLPSAQVMIFDAFGNGSAGLSDLASQWVHHTVQRGPSNFYFMDGNEFAINVAWGNIYNGALKDLDLIISKSKEQGASNYSGIAKLLKAYTYTMAIDFWGIAVFTDYGKGADNFFPKYDKGEDVYSAAFTLISEAKDELGKSFPASLDIITKGNGADQIYGGDLKKWLKFANSLKLKLYNQVRLTSLYNVTDVSALLTENNFISTVDEGFRLLYNSSNTPENRHPLFTSDYIGAPNNYINPYFYLSMNGTGTYNPLLTGIVDPRIPYYFYNQLATGESAQNKTAYKNGNFVSIWFASFNIDPNEGFDQGNSQTIVGLYPCGGAYDDAKVVDGKAVKRSVTSGLAGAGFQRLYPLYAQLYTRAELALTMGTGENALTLLTDAIKASFAEVNSIATIANAPVITDVARDTYITSISALYTAGSASKKLEILMSQKWTASFGFGADPYTDYRRTGYPLMFDPATDNNPLTVLNRNYPVSFPLDVFDTKTNPNAPTDRNPGITKIFWDID